MLNVTLSPGSMHNIPSEIPAKFEIKTRQIRQQIHVEIRASKQRHAARWCFLLAPFRSFKHCKVNNCLTCCNWRCTSLQPTVWMLGADNLVRESWWLPSVNGGSLQFLRVLKKKQPMCMHLLIFLTLFRQGLWSSCVVLRSSWVRNFGIDELDFYACIYLLMKKIILF